MTEPRGSISRASRLLGDIRRPKLQEKLGRALRGGGVAFADQSLVSGVNFVTTILLARVIGPDGFGVYSLAWIGMLFVAGIQVAFLGSAMMSIGPKQEASQRAAYFGAVLVQQAAFSAVCLVVVAVLWAGADRLAPDGELARLALPLSVAVLTYQLQEFFRRYFYARERTSSALTIDTVCYPGRLVLLAWLLATEQLTVETAIWAVAATTAMSSLLGALMLGPLAWEPSGFAEVARRHWAVSRWLMASVLLQWSSNNLFVVCAGWLLGASAVGAIKAAQGLLGVLHVLFQTVENTVVVRASKRLQQGGAPAVTSLLRQVGLGYGWVPTSVAIVFAAVPEFWLTLVFGDSYAGYGHLVRWFAAIYLVMFVGAILRSGLRAAEHTRPIFVALLGTTAFTLLAVYPLVHWLGLTGVMAGMLTVHLIRQLTFWKALQAWMADAPSPAAPAAPAPMRQP